MVTQHISNEPTAPAAPATKPPAKGPIALPPVGTKAGKKKVSKKAASKKKVSKKKSAKRANKNAAAPAAKAVVARECDVAKLTAPEKQKRLAKTYALQRKVETAQAKHTLQARAARASKKALGDAGAALEQEIHDQRFGAGPLFPVT